MQTLAVIIVLQVMVILLTGCSQLDNKLLEQKDIQGKLICQPVDATGCIGWNE